MVRDLEPRKPLLIFGDGLQGEVQHYQKGIITEDGMKWIRIEFRPTQELVDFFHLSDEDFTDPDMKTFTIEYPEVYVEILSEGDPHHQCVLVFCDFKGRQTKLTQRNLEIINSNKLMQREIASLKTERAKLLYDLQIASENYGKYAQKQLDEVFKPISTGMKSRMEPYPDVGSMGGE